MNEHELRRKVDTEKGGAMDTQDIPDCEYEGPPFYLCVSGHMSWYSVGK